MEAAFPRGVSAVLGPVTPHAVAPRPPRSRRAGAALWAPPLDRGSALPLSRQLATALRRAIAEGSFGAGARLPSTRALAAELGIARSTVVTVFEQLAAEGYIAARPGSGYFVPEALIDIDERAGGSTAAGAPRPISRQAELLAGLAAPPPKQPRPFDLGHAEIDGRFIATWKRLAARALSRRSRLSWRYGDPQGEPALRRAIAEYLAAARGGRCRPAQLA